MRLAEIAADGLNNAFARAVLPFCLSVWPGVMRVTASLTRVTQPLRGRYTGGGQLKLNRPEELSVVKPTYGAMQ